MPETLNQTPAQIASRIRNLGTGSRLIFIVLLTVIGIAVVNWPSSTKSPVHCQLFGDCELDADELQRIELTLHTAGKHDFEIRDDRVWVATDIRDDYLKVLETLDALPNNKPSLVASTNPFSSPSQQAAQRLAQKKRSVEKALRRIKYIDQAWFEMDVAPGETAFQPDRHTASVQIRPAPSENLDSQRIHDIRQIISGIIAALRPAEILVTDLKSGMTYSGPVHQAFTQTVGWKIEALEHQAQLERQIQQALKPYSGVRFEIDYQAAVPTPEQEPASSIPAKMASFRKPGAEESLYGANGTVFLEPREGQDASAELAEAELAVQTSKRRANLRVTVQISEAAVLPTPSDNMPTIGELEERLAELKSQISHSLERVLPELSSSPDASFNLKFVDPELSSMAAAEAAFPWDLSKIKFFPTLIIGCLGCLLMTASVTFFRPPRSFPNASVSSASEENVPRTEGRRRQQAEDRLSQLIDSDPEAAAQVLKGWIKKSA